MKLGLVLTHLPQNQRRGKSFAWNLPRPFPPTSPLLLSALLLSRATSGASIVAECCWGLPCTTLYYLNLTTSELKFHETWTSVDTSSPKPKKRKVICLKSTSAISPHLSTLAISNLAISRHFWSLNRCWMLLGLAMHNLVLPKPHYKWAKISWNLD